MYLATIDKNVEQVDTQVDRWWWSQQKKWGAAYSWNNSGTITATSRSSVLKNAMEWKKHKPPNFNKILTKKQNSSNSWSNFWRWDFQIQKGQHSHWNERGGLKWWPVAKLQIYIQEIISHRFVLLLVLCICIVCIVFIESSNYFH